MTILEHIWLPVAVVVSVMAALAFWWWWPKWQVNRLALEIRDPKARADLEDSFRRTVGQLLGGAAVLRLVEAVGIADSIGELSDLKIG